MVTGWLPTRATSQGVAGVRGTLSRVHTHGELWTAGLAGHSAFELLTKGKGRLILPSDSQEHPLLSSP